MAQIIKIDMNNEPKRRAPRTEKYQYRDLEVGEGFLIHQLNGKPSLASIRVMLYEWGFRFDPRRLFSYQDQNNGTVLVWRTHDFDENAPKKAFPKKKEKAE